MPEYPELLTDAAETLAMNLEAHGIEPDRAADLAFQAVDDLRRRWGGLQVYIPKAEYLELATRHQEVFERYRAGWDERDIAREAGYTERRVRQIIRTARLLRAAKVHAPPLLEDA